jgi:recombination protein RecA
MERAKKPELLSTQMKRKVENQAIDEKKEYDGNFGTVISTGSTLLDLSISGGRIRGGGVPGGILVEAFGPSSSGKTVLLSEIAGGVQRQGGEAKFADPEARLNKQFASIFGLNLKDKDYTRPDTVTEVFKAVRAWKAPETKAKVIHGWFADSLAALSTDMEMKEEDGDKMGMRRAKEFSEQLRKTCRILAEKNYLMVCSNQVRENIGATKYEPQYSSPGGVAVGFYSSLRLRFSNPRKIWNTKDIVGKDVKRCIGVDVDIEVFKSSIWKPFHTAPVSIIFDYGVDDIRANLQFVKDYTKNTKYMVGEQSLATSFEKSIRMVEKLDLVKELKEQVIDLWEEIEEKFETERKPKR